MEQDEKKLEKLRSYALTTVFEKQEPITSFDEEIEPLVESKLNSGKILKAFENKLAIHQPTTEKSLNVLAVTPEVKSEIIAETNVEVKVQTNINEQNAVKDNEVDKKDINQEELVYKAQQDVISATNEIESSNSQLIKEELSINAAPKNSGFRTKVFAGAFACLIALFGGWVISNTVNIANTYNSIGIENATSEANQLKIGKLIKEINALDNDREPNPDSTLVPIEDIIPITPLPLENPTSYERESNWFDKICNWLSNIFGG